MKKNSVNSSTADTASKPEDTVHVVMNDFTSEMSVMCAWEDEEGGGTAHLRLF